MKLLSVLASFALLTVSAFAATPRLASERLVFHTIAGDMVFALYPDVAPKHVEQLLTLVRLGVFDGTHFFRIEPSFVLQLSGAAERLLPMSAEQSSKIKKLPLEVTPDLKHAAGVLSMARYDGDENSAETSFSILLNFAPHLDGKYTIFGHLESGVEVLLELVKSPRDVGTRPRTRLTVDRAEVVASPAELAKMTLASVRPIIHAEPPPRPKLQAPVLWGLAFLALLSLAFALLGKRIPVERSGSLHLLTSLTAAFLFVIAILPALPHSSWVGVPMLGGLIFLFRSLGKFESV